MTQIRKHTKITAKRPRTGSASPGKRGLRGIDIPQAEIARQTASVIPFLIKTVVVVGIATFVIYKYQNRFKKMPTVRSYPDANISDGQAEARAQAIYNAMGLFSNSFSTVKAQIQGLNYNGFVKLYNAFGTHTGRLLGLGKEMDLIAWCSDQFDDEQIAQLRFLMGGAFF